jgi:RimJ/RimL family protein N-acetyltransferase
MIPVLQTARLTLRGPLPGDVAPLAAFMASDRAKWIGGPYPAEDAAEWLDTQAERWQRFGRGSWIAALQGSDTPVGRVGILEHDGWPEPELGWFLFADHEGNGYAQEAALAARAYCNGALGLPPLFSFIEPANTRSRALAERLGAVHERDARFRDYDFRMYRHPGPEALS